VSAAVRGARLRFGFGGIGRAGARGLPIPSDLIYAQYARLGGRAALVSRAFGAEAIDLRDEIRCARDRLAWWCGRSPRELERVTATLCERVQNVGAL